MPVLCPACGTENRNDARFCKGCGGKLSSGSAAGAVAAHASEWPATEPAPLQKAKGPSEPFEEEKMVITGPTPQVSHLSAESTLLTPSTAESRMPPAPPTNSFLPPGPPPPWTFMAADDAPRPHPEAVLTLPEPKSSHGLGIGVAVLLIAVLAGAGWYWFAVRSATPAAPMALAPPATMPAATGPVEPSTAPAVAMTSTPDAAPAASVGPVGTAAPAKPKKTVKAPMAATATPAVTAAVAVAAPTPTPTPTPTPAPLPPAAPQAECAGRNFFAMAQCMVGQCAKAEFKSHPQCEAVRKQQRIDEEKRNPSMAN